MILKFIVLAAAFFVLASLWGFYISVRPAKIVSSITPKDLGLDFENVSFKTGDGVTLKGWFIPTKKEGAKTIILLHGYPADKGNILPPMAFLADQYNLFLFDFRYLGESEGSYTTAGAKEVEDLLAAIQYLKGRGIEEVGVWGFSMGGAVALMAAKEAPEIKAIISDSSYARLDLMALRLYPLPVIRYPLAYFTRLWGKILLGIDIKHVSPEVHAQDLTIPILIIHSIDDEVIPFVNALRLKEALKNNPRAEFWFKENLVHGQFGEEYERRIEEFFEKNL